jgi:hypothetical protein
MAFLRFRPAEYRAIACLCRPLLHDECPPRFIKRLLIASLTDALPELATRISRLSQDELKLLLGELRERPAAEKPHGLTPDEVELIAQTGVLLSSCSRFIHLLKRALVRRLAEWHPELAMKVDRMSLRQFESLCEAARDRSEPR